jgi:hypothetical protein
LTLGFGNQKIDATNSFFTWAAFYINGVGQLKSEALIFPNNTTDNEKKMTSEWFKTIKLPQTTERFVDVKSGG